MGRRRILRDMRDRLISAADDAKPNELPGIARELRMVLAEIDRLGSGASREGTRVDQLAARRAQHVAEAAARASAT